MAFGFKYFDSSTPGMPVLNGQPGSLISVLDHILEVSDAASGWEKVYSAVNKAVYRPRTGLRHYFRVDDTGSLASGGRDAAVRCYESMTGIDSGTDEQPLIAAGWTTPYWRKSQTADATRREYRAIKTGRYLFILIGYRDAGERVQALVVGQVPVQHPAENYPWVFGVSHNEITTSATFPYPHIVGCFAQAAPGPDLLAGLTASPLVSGLTIVSTGSNGNVSGRGSTLTWARNPAGSIRCCAGGVVLASYASNSAAQSAYSLTNGAEVRLVRADLGSGDSNSAAATLYPRSFLPNVWTTAANLSGSGWAVGDTFTASDRPGTEFVYAGQAGTGAHIILEMTDTGGAE